MLIIIYYIMMFMGDKIMDKIKSLMKMKQTELAKILHISQARISIMRNKPSIKVMRRMSEYLNIPIRDVVGYFYDLGSAEKGG